MGFSPAEVFGMLSDSLGKNPVIQWVLLAYLFLSILLGLSRLFTDPEQGWYGRRVRRLRYLADSVREESRTRGYLEGLAETEAFRKAVGLPRSISPNQQELVLGLAASGELTATETRYAAEFVKPTRDEKVGVAVGRVDKFAYWWSVVGLSVLGGFGVIYLLLAAWAGIFATTATLILVLEIVFGVGLMLSQMRPVFVARRLKKKLAVAQLLEDGPRRRSDPLRYEDGLLTAVRGWTRRRRSKQR